MTTPPDQSPLFELTSSGVQARAQERDGTWVVLAGSQARRDVTESFKNSVTPGYRNRRQELIEDGTLQLTANGAAYEFTRDAVFRGSTEAASVIMGRSTDGTRDWVTALPNGRRQTHGEWLAARDMPAPPPIVPPVTGQTWKPFFRELAARLLDFEDRQPELIGILRNAGIAINHDEGEPLAAIDPFTFFSLILKHTSDASALALFARVGAALGVQAPVPTDLTGVPWSNPMNAWFFAYRSTRQPEDVPTLWQLARQAVAGDLDAGTFGAALNIRKVALPKLTQGLFWLNPQQNLALNSVNVPYLKVRGVPEAGQVQTLEEYRAVLEAARNTNPDFAALSHAAWLEAQASAQGVALDGGTFPFSRFVADATEYAPDRVKGNLVLDRRYAPLLLEVMTGDWDALKPTRSPYSGREQLAVKVGLGGGVKTDGGAFARALLFADDSGFEYVPFPAGLTLEAGLPDGKGDGPRQALQAARMWDEVLAALNAPLPVGLQATLTLNTAFGPLSLLPLGPGQEKEAAGQLGQYARGQGLSRRLRVGLSLSPAQLESNNFPELLGAALSYLDALLGVLDRLMRHGEQLAAAGEVGGVIEVPGTHVSEVPPAAFVPVPGVPLNQILYGPPGTGKTYRVVDEALSVLDPAFLAAHPGSEGRAARKSRYDELAAQGQISFVTFHQSFGYEDFIEGIKPVMSGGSLSYVLQDGVFLEAVRAAGGDLAAASPAAQAVSPPTPEPTVRAGAQVWRIYIDGAAPVSQIRERSLARGEMRVGSWGGAVQDLTGQSYDGLSEQQILFRDGVRVGDLVVLATGADRMGGVGVVTGEYRFDPAEPIFATDYAHARPVRWLATGLNLGATATLGKSFSQQTIQRVAGVTPEQVLAALKLPTATEEASMPHTPGQRPHVLIIDEINRGNISKIFGELITLLESGKRAGASEALTVTLPLSRRPLAVPQSLYVIGTMNTADRSLTLLDAALRRRFVFRPVWPQPEVLPVLDIGGTALDLRKFLHVINDRIERLLGREQVIGHAYLLGLPATLGGVASAVRERILPLLEEYFFEDWSKIREVLADEDKAEELQFIHRVKSGSETRYRLNPAAFENIEAFTGVYDRVSDADFPFGA
ncbi:protein of unknown function [Deinococcus reticulitermitis]|uniref:Uncharacterized protein n=1 Tax=Deinococcus reticulitermitis TaxID=856736 RepID=A0A1H7BTB0_9DEIO|nr:DUF4357 domain-containing protein [Deinococcus reticulitermitis]SEJ79567.1 protein of unknown function [Deinococcus reticulitermitis]